MSWQHTPAHLSGVGAPQTQNIVGIRLFDTLFKVKISFSNANSHELLSLFHFTTKFYFKVTKIALLKLDVVKSVTDLLTTVEIEKEDQHASSCLLSKYLELTSIQEKSIFLQKVE